MAVMIVCQLCGQETPRNSGPQKYCPDCAKKADHLRSQNRDQRKAAVEARRRATERKKRQQAGREGAKVSAGAVVRETDFTLSQWAAMARNYLPPYNSYGQLKAYVRLNGHLPPREALKPGKDAGVAPIKTMEGNWYNRSFY